MTEELKPCPFCGGAAHITDKTINEESRNMDTPALVDCADCGAGGAPQDSIVEAIKAWNTRK